MSHEVESMYYVSNEENGRFTPWHGLGVSVEKAPTSADAMVLGGLDWNVKQQPLYTDNNLLIPNYKVNMRDKDDAILGVVTDRYRVVQNSEAFAFTDALLGEGVTYETAGVLKNGKTVWLLANMPSTTILGDKVDPYMVFTNSHDGLGAIKVCMTPIRVVCNNTLNFALNRAERCWSAKHVGDMLSKLDEAKHTLNLAQNYMKELNNFAEEYAAIHLNDDQISKIVAELFPISENDKSDRKIANIEKARESFMFCYLAPDLANYLHTAYGVIQAASDFATHTQPSRLTESYKENNFARVLNGHPIIDKCVNLVKAVA